MASSSSSKSNRLAVTAAVALTGSVAVWYYWYWANPRRRCRIEVDLSLVEEAEQLDQSELNRSNIAFSRLSMKIAQQILRASSSSSSSQLPLLKALEAKHVELAAAWNDTTSSRKPPFCVVEGVKYAIDAQKIGMIDQPGHVRIIVPFYCEFERGMPATKDNPNGEESPLQKVEEVLFLLAYNGKISMDLIFVNDSIAEKKDDKNNGGSSKLFKTSILAYMSSKNMAVDICKGDKKKAGPTATDEDYDVLTALNGQLYIKFTSCEVEASKGSPYESPSDKRKRMENRDANGKLQERKGGAVLTGMELPIDNNKFAGDEMSQRVIRCLVDGDSAHPVASFVGDAAYSILQLGNTAYLGNLRDPSTCVSVVGEDSGGGSAGTHARVQNRKLMFSGFIVPFLFPELSDKYKYTGTTQLPIKAFRGDIDFAKAKLPTVQPNVDLGMLALLCSYLNTNGGSIDSGPVTIRDNIASSTMTTSDLEAEWSKTYGPIFTSAVGLCRDLKPTEFQQLPSFWTNFIENMGLEHYTTLFDDDATDKANVVAFFDVMKEFRGSNNRPVVLEKLKGSLKKII